MTGIGPASWCGVLTTPWGSPEMTQVLSGVGVKETDHPSQVPGEEVAVTALALCSGSGKVGPKFMILLSSLWVPAVATEGLKLLSGL